MFSSDGNQFVLIEEDQGKGYQGNAPKLIEGYINAAGVKSQSDVKTEENIKQKVDKDELLIEKDKENGSYHMELTTSKLLTMDDSMYDPNEYPNPPKSFLGNRESDIDLDNIPSPPNSSSVMLASQYLSSQLLDDNSQIISQGGNENLGQNLKEDNEKLGTNSLTKNPLTFTNNMNNKMSQSNIPLDKMVDKSNGYQQDKVSYGMASAMKYRGSNKSLANSNSLDNDRDEKPKPRSNPCTEYCLMM